MQTQKIQVAAKAAGARGGPKNIRDVIDDMLTALEEGGLNGVWAVFAEMPDVVVLQKEGGYEVALVGRFVKIRITTDVEFNMRHVDVEYE
jgi:hypothetical protein